MGRAALPRSSTQRFIEITVGLTSWLLISSPLWGSILFPVYWSWAFLAFAVYWLGKSAYLVVQGFIASRTLQIWEAGDWAGLARRLPRGNRMRHLVVFPTYGEPLEVLADS